MEKQLSEITRIPIAALRGTPLLFFSTESLDQGYHNVAQQLRITAPGGEDADVKKLVRDFLSEDAAGQWVLVFDNADDMQMWSDKSGSETQRSTSLMDYIPRSKTGRVIFTTRDRKFGVKLAQQSVVEVSQMTLEESKWFATRIHSQRYSHILENHLGNLTLCLTNTYS